MSSPSLSPLLFSFCLISLVFDQNEEQSYIVALDNFILGKKCSPLFRMTLLDSDTLLCLIKLINCLMDHKSAYTLMGPGFFMLIQAFLYNIVESIWYKPFFDQYYISTGHLNYCHPLFVRSTRPQKGVNSNPHTHKVSQVCRELLMTIKHKSESLVSLFLFPFPPTVTIIEISFYRCGQCSGGMSRVKEVK